MATGKILFITGTGTDVGKSALSLAVLSWAKARGLGAAYCKPVQCGETEFGSPPRRGGDAEWLAHVSGAAWPAQVTYKLRMAASPHLAAEREGVAIDPARIRADLESLAGANDLVVCEGAGGAAVPLDRRGASLGGLAASMGIPALIAAAPGLGTLHHTLATLAWLRQAGAEAAGFAFCARAPEPEPLAGDNRSTLEALSGLPCFGTVPWTPALAEGRPLSGVETAALWSQLAGALDAWSARPC